MSQSPSAADTGLSREAVVWAYRLFLGREPENETVVEAHRRHPDLATLRRVFLDSDELNLIKAHEFVHGDLAWLRGRWVAAPVLGGQYLMWLDLGDTYVSLGCLLDNYEPDATRFVRTVLAPGGVFADVGANVGWYTLLASSIVGAPGYCHAFEPRTDTGIYLAKTIALNGLEDRVVLHRCALSDTTGRGLLTWPDGTANPGGSYLVAADPGAGHEWQEVELRCLDSLMLPRLDFLKIDVEGAEMRVFAGAHDTLARCRPAILSELCPDALRDVSGVSPEAFFAYFDELGYRCYIVDGERWGDEIRAMPGDWPRPFVNVGLLPKERAFTGLQGI